MQTVQTVQTPVKTANVVNLDAITPPALFMRHNIRRSGRPVIICRSRRLAAAPLCRTPLSSLDLFGTQAGLGTMVTGISDGSRAYNE